MKQIFFVNTSLGMRKGKIAAQVAHASFSWGFSVNSQFKKWEHSYVRWCLNGCAKVVLRASQEDIDRAAKLPDAIVVQDEGRTQVEPGSTTVVALPPLEEKDMPPWVKSLKLL